MKNTYYRKKVLLKKDKSENWCLLPIVIGDLMAIANSSGQNLKSNFTHVTMAETIENFFKLPTGRALWVLV